ncbi:homocitrate synthase/isopropylmalate synthase family protein [Clostridium coskatii]|nr:homocitrate synthase [Clostridium coskatii]
MNCVLKGSVCMSIILGKEKKLIVDRTLPEVVKRAEIVDQDLADEFITLVKNIGVDFIEINGEVLQKIKNLPENVDYIYRVGDLLDVYEFEHLIIDYKKAEILPEEFLNKLRNKKIILEVDIKVLEQFNVKDNCKIFGKLNIICIRIKGIVKYNIAGWNRLIENIKNRFSVYVDFCADDKFYMATSVSIESCVDGADVVTAAFNGQVYGFASLEEVILGLKVIKGGKVCGNLEFMEQLVEVYTKLTHKKVHPMKAVIGEDIFKYESGIHVDGIEKNPDTYEPYNPYDIGKKRIMYIGKHSGKKAVMIKLKELNIDYQDVDIGEFLKEVRKNSIKLKRNIFDKELISMFNDFKNIQ